ncbi:sugar porter family MFS transporter [Gryllotalpicola protaetiae]|uniref:MFS transporter n=1 Tax=Gryllotalpicola protaetiae TaxID=2419771 RepID=A0A387BM62_9MICO|nr:sugar porter family MFS transporter [Gryllotalpicola protaetiae]AYG02126.1 MFS transporter [Gryllotalpicola protaetiae]
MSVGQIEQIDPRFRRRVTGLAIAAAVGGFLFGFDSSVINGAVDAIGKEIVAPAVSGPAEDFVKGFVVAIALLGSAAGAWIAGSIADRWGRPRVMLLGAILFFVSAIGAGLAQTVWDLGFWRVIGGLGIGIASVIAPAYIGEVAPKSVRGGLASLQQLAITIGIFVALLSDFILNSAAGNEATAALWFNLGAWRWMFIVGVIPAIVYGYLALRVPESPRYLLLVGKRDEARGVFETIVPKDEVEGAVADIEKAIAEDKKNANATLRGPSFGLHPIVWVGIILSVFQQFVGINVVFYYSNSLWTAVGLGDHAFLLSVISGIINVLVTFIAIALVDRIGRRILLLIGSVGMAIPLGLEAVAFSFATLHDGQLSLPTGWAVVSVVSANVFIIAFGATWGPLVWVLLGEIFPSRIRARALGVAAAAQWIANFIISETFPPLSAWSLPWTYTIYAVFAALSFFFVFFRVPETKGVALEHTEDLFLKRHPELRSTN